MDIAEIGHKANSRPVTNRMYQLDAEEFNAMLDELMTHRSLLDMGVSYSVRIENNLDSRNLTASLGRPCEVKFTYRSQMRDGLSEWENTGETANLKMYIKNAVNAEFTLVREMKVTADLPVSVNVAEYLASGSNQLMLEATGEISKKTTSNFVYTITLTSLSISAEGFAWWDAYAEDFNVPFIIAGNVSKILVVSVSGSGYSKTYEVELGSMVYTDSPYNYRVKHPGQTGVFKITAYLRNVDGSIRTSPISYNTICYLRGSSSKLMALNNIASELTNWNETAVFDYSIFEGEATTAGATFSVSKDGVQVFKREDSAIPTKSKQTFLVPLAVETIDDLDFNVEIKVVSGSSSLISPLTLPVNNSLGFSPSAGATIYINPRTRSNSERNYLKLVNEITGEEFSPNWKNVNWYNDGHTVDEEGNPVLRLLPGGYCDTGIPILKPESARTGKVIEMEFKINTVTDNSVPVINCSDTTTEGFTGLRVYPESIVAMSSGLKRTDDQSFKYYNGERIHFVMAIMPDIYGHKNFNICKMYVNGVPNREFSYESNDYFLTESTLKLGSDFAGIDIYGIRIYDNALSSDGIIQNYVNWRSNNAEKEQILAMNDVYDASKITFDIEKIKNLCNVVVFESEIPSYTNPNKFRGNGYIYWRDHPEWNITLRNVPIDKQGTSSSFYYKWNLRWKCDDNTIIIYKDQTQDVKKFYWKPGFPKASKITFKLNWASSCQCNKMGSVNSINDVATLLNILNEIKARPSIYQDPFVGFQLTYNEEGDAVYTLLGLYTAGPDKSDSGTMGLDTKTYPNLLFVEGADNGSKIALFKVPWNPNKPYVRYNADEESLQYNGENGWDYDGGAPDGEKEQAEVQALYERVWMPRYNFVYQCSHSLTYWPGTLAELNSAENILRYRDADTEFWLDGGNVYYYEAAEGKFVPSDIGNGTINLYTQLVDKGYGLTSSMTSGKTGTQLNDLFRAARIAKFSLEAPQYFHKKASIFTRNWIEFMAGSDNRTKNTYFIMLGTIEEGFLVYFIHDDTDTIGPWTNQGQDKKGYWVEVGDKYDNGQPVWNGEQNRFFNLVEAAWPTEIKEGMHEYMDAMIELGGSNEGNYSDKLYKFFHKYYFAMAQEYFPEALYAAAAKLLYEEGKLALIAGTYENDTDPMTQSMGDYYSGWKRWIKYRIEYMQSKYAYGDYSAKGTGHIIVRAAGNDITYDITPAIWMYPCVATGTSIIRGERTPAGETSQVTISLGGAADQQNQIKGAHYLQSIGGWWNKNVTGTMTVVGRMLRELRIGHPTETIIISISALQIADTPSLQLLDVRRVATLKGVLNLSSCIHIVEIYASGSSLTQIALPSGGPLQHIEYPTTNQYIVLRNFPLLKAAGVVMGNCMANVSDFLVEGCEGLNPIDLLRQIMAAQKDQTSHTLKRVRAVGFNATYDNAEGASVLEDLAKLADGSYVGLDSSGLAGSEPYPVLDGTLNVNANVYEDDVQKLRATFPRLKLNITGNYYVKFADPEVKRIVVSTWGDGVGITMAQVRSIEKLNRKFNGNTLIKTFNEFALFVNVNTIDTYMGDFRNCTSLESIKVPPLITKAYSSMFNGCSSLIDVQFSTPIDTIEDSAFYGCSSLINFDFTNIKTIKSNAFNKSGLTGQVKMPNLEILEDDVFNNTTIEDLADLGKITAVNMIRYMYDLVNVNLHEGITTIKSQFARTGLSTLVFPSTVTLITAQLFYLTSIKKVVFKSKVPPEFTGNGILGGPMIYVPDASLEAYKTSTFWSQYASKIKPLSEFVE